MAISITNGIVNEAWEFAYDGEQVELKVEGPRRPHSLFVKNTAGFTQRDPWGIFFRILNELVWFHHIRVSDINGGHGDYCANMNFLPHDDNYAIRLFDFEQQVFDETQHLALGFYREGISSGSAYYMFICFAKILEIPFRGGKDKGNWINQQLKSLDGQHAVYFRDHRVHMLGGKTLGMWLQQEGRNAVSHGNIQSGDTVRDPNNCQDWDDIKLGNVVMQELAEKAMLQLLKIPPRCH